MDTGELVAELEKILGVKIPRGTLRRWASEELISGPTPYGRKGQRGGCYYSWPIEAFEDAAVVYTLRNRDLLWGKTIRGWPTTKKGKEKTTVSTKMLLEAKKMVKHLYASIDEGLIEHTELVDIKYSKKDKLDRMGRRRLGGVTQPVYVVWVTTLEKIRHNKPLAEPLKVVFHWRNVNFVEEDGGKSFKLKYDGVSVESCEHEMVRHDLTKDS